MFAMCFRYLFQQAALMSLLGVLTPIADAQPATCDESDSTCYTNELSPARGEALLQHQAQREQSVPNSHVHKLFGSVIQVDETLTSSEDPPPEGSDSDKNSGNEDTLPAGAMELFNAKLCSIKSGSASSRSTAASRTASSSHSAESSHDDTRESSHDDRRSLSAKHNDTDDNGKDEHNDRKDHGKEEHSDKDDRDDRDEPRGRERDGKRARRGRDQEYDPEDLYDPEAPEQVLA